LRKLPESVEALTQLQLLELISCKLENLPDCLFQLPNLKILKIAGNPFTELNLKRLNYLPNLEQPVVDKHQAQKISYLNPNVRIEIMHPNKDNFRY
jgi:Leucine-rich repeat (LRR) protein